MPILLKNSLNNQPEQTDHDPCFRRTQLPEGQGTAGHCELVKMAAFNDMAGPRSWGAES